jgi:hypothetical protein
MIDTEVKCGDRNGWLYLGVYPIPHKSITDEILFAINHDSLMESIAVTELGKGGKGYLEICGPNPDTQFAKSKIGWAAIAALNEADITASFSIADDDLSCIGDLF